MNKKLIWIPALALISILSYTSIVKADDVTGPWHEQMVSQLAAKLGVSEDSVDSAMGEVAEQHRAEGQYRMQANLEERLQALVDEGKLTSGQRDAWLDKHEEMVADREAQRLSHQEEMQAWFAEQGIDPTLIGPMGQGRGRGEGRGMGMHRLE